MPRGIIWSISAGGAALLAAIAGVVWFLFLQRAGHAELCLEAARVHLKRPQILDVERERELGSKSTDVTEFELSHGTVRTNLTRTKFRCEYSHYTHRICSIRIDDKPLEDAVVDQIDMAVHGRSKVEGGC